MQRIYIYIYYNLLYFIRYKCSPHNHINGNKSVAFIKQFFKFDYPINFQFCI